MIESVKLKEPHLANKDLKVVQSKPVPVPFGMPNLHFLQAIVGGRGQGKTTMLINEILAYNKAKCFEKIYMFSPTLFNDPKYSLIESSEGCNVKTFTSYSDDLFKDVLSEIKSDIDVYKEYERKKKIWDRFTKAKKIEIIEDEDLMELYLWDFQEPVEPFRKFPCSLLVFDDLAGNKELYRGDSKGVFNAFVILHRHLACSCIFLSQIYHNAVPRQIRVNISWWVLFKNRNKDLRKQIATELSGPIDPEVFKELWDMACKENHDFFMVDYDAKDGRFQYRRNFDELLLLS